MTTTKDLAEAVQLYHAIEVGKDVADWADEKVQEYGALCIAHGRKAEIIDRSKLINESILKGRSLERERIWAKLMQHIGGQTLHADSVILLSKLESIIFGEGEK